ncbi:GNAT family N-acetyltransferase [Streptomyces triticisoli]|uniref:GNAT family N-acetyltransferase n=1 Tax=Streptomyces triticisoli TaxID=2182797 RepID=UPI000DD8B7E4|nr:hypothetical protein [Streptomyces triticisoli]
MTTTVRDSPEQRRYEIHEGRAPAGFSDYGITGRKNASTHTSTYAETLPDFSGRGPARQPVVAGTEDARRTTTQDSGAYGGPRPRERAAPLRPPRDGDGVTTTRRRGNHTSPGTPAARDLRCGRQQAIHHRSGGTRGMYGNSGTAR